MARQWTTQEREKQRRLINEVRPWERSTGPRTTEGKQNSARNAYKGGLRPLLRESARVLQEQQRTLQELLERREC